MNNNLINVDYFKQIYYRAILPLDKINDFLSFFEKEDVDHATRVLISILNVTTTNSLLDKFKSLEEKKKFLRLCQDDFRDAKILDYLIDKFPGSEQNILETIERTLLSAKMTVER